MLLTASLGLENGNIPSHKNQKIGKHPAQRSLAKKIKFFRSMKIAARNSNAKIIRDVRQKGAQHQASKYSFGGFYS